MTAASRRTLAATGTEQKLPVTAKDQAGLLRSIQYKGHRISLTVLAHQGRWAYRIDDGKARMVDDNRGAVSEDVLYAQAEAAAISEIDRSDFHEAKRAGARPQRS